MRAMCVRAAVFRVCEVRSQFRTFWGKKRPNFGLFLFIKATSNAFSQSYFTLIPNKHKKGIKKCQNLLQNHSFSMNVRVWVRSEFWQNLLVRGMWVRPKIESANVRACEAINRRNSQFANLTLLTRFLY